ncbi:MAG: hypothetical protein K0R50_917 [Eubacterium sp.]|jgi:hypothetical protein|nr:hypothetical protein [Eubacterium sp.]
MNDVDEVLKMYGLVPSKQYLDEIRKLLIEETSTQVLKDHELLKTLCVQLFAIGCVEDTSLIWRAKRKDFDAGCYIDVQLLCGAGVEETTRYLKELRNHETSEELDCLQKSIIAGDFNEFSKDSILDFYKGYYGIS